MNKFLLLTLLLAAIGAWFACRPARQPTRKAGSSHPAGKSTVNMGRDLRQRMLTTSPSELGMKPSSEFPRVYAVLMEWPIEEDVATVFSTSTGAASLYTTSAFGIVGGEAHDAVKIAAKAFVGATDHYFTRVKADE